MCRDKNYISLFSDFNHNNYDAKDILTCNVFKYLRGNSHFNQISI